MLDTSPSPARTNGVPATSQAFRPFEKDVRVLVVDDEPDAAESMAMLLRMYGFVAMIANDGRQAIEMSRTGRPRYVLLDIGLPRMDGYEVAAQIRRELADSVTLIALTGYDHAQDGQLSRNAGFDCRFVKPVMVEEILRVLSAGSLVS